MNILALNTAFVNSDVAILYNNQKFTSSLNSSAKHSENILMCIDNLLKSNNADIQNINVMSAVVGPGSFTGIRIGVGLVKGMHLFNPNIKLVAISSLDLMAYIFAKNQNKDFWCVINALSGNIFVCQYNSFGQRITEPEMLTPDNINKVCGTIVGLKIENLSMCNHFIDFDALSLLDYTIQLCNQNQFVEESKFLPIYLRKSQAEVGLENANKKN